MIKINETEINEYYKKMNDIIINISTLSNEIKHYNIID